MGSSGGILGPVSNVLFGDGGAGAAQSAAMAQQGAAGRAYREARDIMAPVSTAALLTSDSAIKAQERGLARQEELIKQIDPAIIEASQQALKLLRGESSSALAPVERQRAQQRQTLLNSLREQLGPGAETSTAGMQALSRFDSETSNLTASQQQNALQGIGSIYGTLSNFKPSMGQEAGVLGNLASNRFGIAQNQASTLLGAQQGVIQNAGAQYTGAVLRGQQNAAFGQALIGGAGTALGGYLGGMGK